MRACLLLSALSCASSLVISVHAPHQSEAFYLGQGHVTKFAVVSGNSLASDHSVVSVIFPYVNVSVMDGDFISRRVAENPEAWVLCFRLLSSSNAQLDAHCGPLQGAPPALVAARCKGFTVLGADSLQLETWAAERDVDSSGKFFLTGLQSSPTVSPYSKFPEGSWSRRSIPKQQTVHWPPFQVDVPEDSSFQEMKALADASFSKRIQTNNHEEGGGNADDLLDHLLFHSVRPVCVLPAHDQDPKPRPARILILGDCHPLLFAGGYGPRSLKETRTVASAGGNRGTCRVSNYHVCSVAGASAHGLGNRNATTAAARQFRTCVRRWAGPNAMGVDFVALHIGEVDFRSVYPLRADAKNVTMLEQIEASSSRLFAFVQDNLIAEHGFTMDQIVVMGTSVTCPYRQRQPHANSEVPQRREFHVHSSSAATIRYHAALERRCRELGCTFLNPQEEILDLRNGMPKQEFWNKPLEMHCNAARLFYVWHMFIKSKLGLSWCEDGERPPEESEGGILFEEGLTLVSPPEKSSLIQLSLGRENDSPHLPTLRPLADVPMFPGDESAGLPGPATESAWVLLVHVLLVARPGFLEANPHRWLLCVRAGDDGRPLCSSPLQLLADGSFEVGFPFEGLAACSLAPVCAPEFEALVPVRLFTTRADMRQGHHRGVPVEVPIASSSFSELATVDAALQRLRPELSEVCRSQFPDPSNAQAHPGDWTVDDCAVSMEQQLAPRLSQCLPWGMPWEGQATAPREALQERGPPGAGAEVSVWLQPIRPLSSSNLPGDFPKEDGTDHRALQERVNLDVLLANHSMRSLASERPPQVSALLTGGLGEQLFQVFAALAYSRRHDLACIFTTHPTSQGEWPHGVNYHHLSYWGTPLFKRLEAVSAIVSSELPPTSSLLLGEGRGGSPLPSPPTRIGETTMVLSGRFHSPVHFQDRAEEIARDLRLSELRAQACGTGNRTWPEDSVAIGLHLSVGDYSHVQPGDRFESSFEEPYLTLPVQYYQAALHRILNSLGDDDDSRAVHVVVFVPPYLLYGNEDPVNPFLSELTALFPGLAFSTRQPEAVGSGVEEEEHDVLTLASCLDHHVISDHLLSWWSAFWSSTLKSGDNRSSRVAAPTFRLRGKSAFEIPDTESLYPSHWFRIGKL